MKKSPTTPGDTLQKGNMMPRTIGAPSKDEIIQNPPKDGETITDDLGQTWGAISPGIVVRHK